LDFFTGREALSLADLQLKELRPAALTLKVKLEEIETQTDANGLDSAFQSAKKMNRSTRLCPPPLARFLP